MFVRRERDGGAVALAIFGAADHAGAAKPSTNTMNA